jgi:NAD(P)-dependent dehydrogenase (short-subunit alcohol dehydrogenase family)
MDLPGKRVVIVGGTSRIGLATARAALAQGATVEVASRDKGKVDQTVGSLGRDLLGTSWT